jgi:hypothetical protein
MRLPGSHDHDHFVFYSILLLSHLMNIIEVSNTCLDNYCH